jgi:hypothetical protein
MNPTQPDGDRWRNMDGKEMPAEGTVCELLLPDGEIITGAVFDPSIRNWRFQLPEHLRTRTLYLSGWRPAKAK